MIRSRAGTDGPARGGGPCILIPPGVSYVIPVDLPKESLMCSPARCARCGKVTWSGCGMHVDSVMANVQPAQRCTCR